MQQRLEGVLTLAGLAPKEASLAMESFRMAMDLRGAFVVEEDDHRFLHPARSLLVLLQDGGERRPDLLAAAPLVESLEPDLLGEVAAVAPEPIEAVLAGLPALPGGLGETAGPDAEARWLEELVLAEPGIQKLILSEALDQLRHLHLRPDGPFRNRILRRAEGILVPLAHRVGGALDRRMGWWWNRVGQRLGTSG